MPPRLCVRLQTVADLIGEAKLLADIGTDHARLLRFMLSSGRVSRGIAIENNPQPWKNSAAGLAGLTAEVRFGDGLSVLKAGEVDALTICGIGGRGMVEILEAYPERIPERVVLQPNTQPELLRDWGLRAGFHLIDERVAVGFWRFEVLSFRRVKQVADPAYVQLDLQAAILLGPWLLRRQSSDWIDDLRAQERYLSRLERLEPIPAVRLATIRNVLANVATFAREP